MKTSRKKWMGLIVLFLFLMALSVTATRFYRDVRQTDLNRSLISAIKQDDMTAVVTLLSKGADPNANDFPEDPRSGWRKLWDFLRARVSPKESTLPNPLAFGHSVLARQTGHKSTALLVALSGKDADSFLPENTALVKTLLDAGARVNSGDEYGFTPLMWAVLSGKQETVRLLLVRGAQINARDAYGFTSLRYATYRADAPICRLLLDRGALANVRAIDGRTPLHEAAFMGEATIVRMLVDQGGEVNAGDDDNRTALAWAALGDHEDCVHLLLAKGAQVNTTDNLGYTPLRHAQEHHNPEMIRLLK